MLIHPIKFLFCAGLLWLATETKAQSLYFPPVEGDTWATLSPDSFGWCSSSVDSLYNFLEENNTRAFILLKDGKIVLEKYFGTFTRNSVWYWASAGKSLTAFLVGLARQDQLLSIDDVSSAYLGQGWTSCTSEQEGKITVRHQLTMTSGLDDVVADPYCTLSSCLVCKADAGTRWAYHNAPYTLLDQVLEKASGLPLNTFVTRKLKNETGISGLFTKVDYNNVFFSTARSMARFGLLVLNRGNWNGFQILTDTLYFSQMTSSSQNINPSYGFLWWLNGKTSFMVPGLQYHLPGYLFPHAPADVISAMGKNGQFIDVVPSRRMVWIRMGEAPDETEVPFLMNDQIWTYLNKFDCAGLGSELALRTEPEVRLGVNRLDDKLVIESDLPLTALSVFTQAGQLVRKYLLSGKCEELYTGEWPAGLFLLRIERKSGHPVTKKMRIFRAQKD